MGMEQAVVLGTGQTPSWPGVRDLLAQRGLAVQVRMIDGQLAFPDEEPPEAWRELRLGTPPGMVTVRRERDRLMLVTWGNAEPALVQTWNALAWAFAEMSGGKIDAGTGPVSAGDFLRTADMPAALRSGA